MKSIGLVPELYSTDIDKTIEFYVDVLEFTILYERKEEKFVYLRNGNAEIMIEQVGIGRNWITDKLEYPFGRGVNLQIETDAINELYARVQQKDAKVFLPIEEKWYRKDDQMVGNKQFMVQDPDGYLLRLYQDLGNKPLTDK